MLKLQLTQRKNIIKYSLCYIAIVVTLCEVRYFPPAWKRGTKLIYYIII